MPDDHKEGYVTGRLSNNTVVHFPGDESLIGKIVDVWLEESKGFYHMESKWKDRELKRGRIFVTNDGPLSWRPRNSTRDCILFYQAGGISMRCSF
ncbi:MAG: TRAM domain-containing protein [Clostridium sp.]